MIVRNCRFVLLLLKFSTYTHTWCNVNVEMCNLSNFSLFYFILFFYRMNDFFFLFCLPHLCFEISQVGIQKPLIFNNKSFMN